MRFLAAVGIHYRPMSCDEQLSKRSRLMGRQSSLKMSFLNDKQQLYKRCEAGAELQAGVLSRGTREAEGSEGEKLKSPIQSVYLSIAKSVK